MASSKEVFEYNLNSLVHQRGWNQSELGQYIGLSQPMARKYLKHGSSPPFHILDRIAKLFGIRVADLFDDKKAPISNFALPIPEEALEVLEKTIQEWRILKTTQMKGADHHLSAAEPPFLKEEKRRK